MLAIARARAHNLSLLSLFMTLAAATPGSRSATRSAAGCAPTHEDAALLSSLATQGHVLASASAHACDFGGGGSRSAACGVTGCAFTREGVALLCGLTVRGRVLASARARAHNKGGGSRGFFARVGHAPVPPARVLHNCSLASI